MLASSASTLTYPIVETFHSLQGEGRWAGVSAFFIRLAGCDVHCPWCDTKSSWSTKPHPHYSIDELTQNAQAVQPAIVVITGGEPLMHDLTPLTQALHQQNLKVHLETSGAYPFSGKFDWVTFSPKPFKSPHFSIYEQANELKVVIAQAEDLRWAEQQAALLKADTMKYLQPEWSSPDIQGILLDYILQHPEWRLSLQTHKYLGIS